MREVVLTNQDLISRNATGRRIVIEDAAHLMPLSQLKVNGSIEQAATPTPNAPQEMVGTSQVYVTGKNLFKPDFISAVNTHVPAETSNAYGTTINSTKFTKEIVVTQSNYDANATSGSQNGYFCIALPKTHYKYNKDYTFIADVTITNNLATDSKKYDVYILPSNGLSNNGAKVDISSGKIIAKITNVPHATHDRNSITITIYGKSLILRNIMLLEGDFTNNVPDYEPYKEQTLTIPELYSADYADFSKKEIVRKAFVYQLKSTDNWAIGDWDGANSYGLRSFTATIPCSSNPEFPTPTPADYYPDARSNYFPNAYDKWDSDLSSVWVENVDGNNMKIHLLVDNTFVDSNGNPGVDLLKTFLDTHDVYVVYQIQYPLSVSMTDEVITAFESLSTYAPITRVFNNTDANMEVEYAIDTKTYVDGEISETKAYIDNKASELEEDILSIQEDTQKITEMIGEALESIEDAKEEAITNISDTGATVLNNINDSGADALNEIATAKNEAKQEIASSTITVTNAFLNPNNLNDDPLMQDRSKWRNTTHETVATDTIANGFQLVNSGSTVHLQQIFNASKFVSGHYVVSLKSSTDYKPNITIRAFNNTTKKQIAKITKTGYGEFDIDIEALTAELQGLTSFDIFIENSQKGTIVVSEVYIGLYEEGNNDFWRNPIGNKAAKTDVEKIREIVETQSEASNPLYGKIITFTGDSICEGRNDNGGSYPKIIGENNAMTVQNLGISGGKITEGTTSFCISSSVLNMREDADYIILEGGVNDMAMNNLGTITDNFDSELDTSTFCGAFEQMIKNAISRFAGKKIGYISVHRLKQWAPDNYNTRFTNTGYYEKAIEICAKWGIPVCNLTLNCPSLYENENLKSSYTTNGDGWHPNEEGYKKYYVPKIEAWLKTL